MSQPLITQAFVQRHQYKDSVALMRVAQGLLALPGVVNASLQLGNAANQDILREGGLLLPALAEAGPGDIMVVVQAKTAAQADAALAQARASLAEQPLAAVQAGDGKAAAPRSLAQALAQHPQSNVVQISAPGAYAAAEALKAVQQGRHVFLFSDNVPLAQEVALKQAAQARGVLVMGPDCGTALLSGVPMGFANAVRRGSIGIVAASGTGLQEVSTQVHRMGGGISHAIGTGGRDTQSAVGAITMRQGIGLLAQDESTRVIVVISKPPAADVAAQVMSALRDSGKPAVVLFIGQSGAASTDRKQRIVGVETLVDAAAAALRLSGRRTAAAGSDGYALPKRPRFAASQRWLRALYAGGTFAAEAQAIWARSGVQVWSNVPLDKSRLLADFKRRSQEHTALDLGDDDFTIGRPHPMIDQSARIERLMQEAADPSVRAVLLDVVIGYGAHADPAAELAGSIEKARALAARKGRHLAVIGFVCGTDADPQNMAAQEARLRSAGMVLAGSSANAAWLAGLWVR